jgi:glycosyltransferase involved in cell wall biosynthesis
LIDGKPQGEAISSKMNNYFPTVFHTISDAGRLKQLFTAFLLFIKYRRECRLVHIACYSTLSFYKSIYLVTLARLFGISYYNVIHGGSFPERLKKSPRLCRYLFGKAVINISPSRYLQYYFKKQGYDVKCIPNFISIENYPYLQRAHLKPRILWVRSFHEIYNTPMAARVFKRLLQKYPDAHLCMVGKDLDGSKAKFEKLCKLLGIQEKVTITGFMRRPDWVKLSVDYDIFISTTTIDNTPMSVIEALALGFPVVTTNVGGIPFLLKNEEDAMLVESDNDEQMFLAIDRLLNDPELVKKITANGRKKAESFDWLEVKKDWDEVVYEIYKNGGKRKDL